ncbi:MAG: HigA family addiction module antitoxin [Alphaproteobacteria bacterium]|jgi:addiction module HigA family antidote|nr:HigA family addiction module antitoxin [Alphaproteobacteria bacterium]
MEKMTRRPTPPGEILRELYLEPRGVSITAFARAVECSRKHMSNIVHGHVRLEPEIAARIAKVLGTSTELWLNLQKAVDVHDAEAAIKNWRPVTRYQAA